MTANLDIGEVHDLNGIQPSAQRPRLIDCPDFRQRIASSIDPLEDSG